MEQWDNYVVLNADGLRRTIVYATSPEQALQRAHAPQGCTARVQNYSDAMDRALALQIHQSWGRLD